MIATSDINPVNLYDVGEVYKFLGHASKDSLRVRLQQGAYPELQHLRIGGRLYFKGAEILKYLESPDRVVERAAK